MYVRRSVVPPLSIIRVHFIWLYYSIQNYFFLWISCHIYRGRCFCITNKHGYWFGHFYTGSFVIVNLFILGIVFFFFARRKLTLTFFVSFKCSDYRWALSGRHRQFPDEICHVKITIFPLVYLYVVLDWKWLMRRLLRITSVFAFIPYGQRMNRKMIYDFRKKQNLQSQLFKKVINVCLIAYLKVPYVSGWWLRWIIKPDVIWLYRSALLFPYANFEPVHHSMNLN